jgi:ribose 5-phosphate isomerase B
MKISIGADHRGFELKQAIIKAFAQIDWLDVGTHSTQRTDYPVVARAVCEQILTDEATRGILLCGSGVGVSIAANRHPGIYAALCWNAELARTAREDDNANILVLPADYLTTDQACDMVRAWLEATFKGGHYQKRLDMID